jgi:hypothetical protein
MERNLRVALYSAVFAINVWVASLLAVTVAQATGYESYVLRGST